LKRLLNDPRHAVREMLEGLADFTPGVALLDGEDVVARTGEGRDSTRRPDSML
jgi:hypothetical protein